MKSNKPLFWSLFAAGGTVAAFVMPVLLVITLLAGYGMVPEALSYERLHAVAGGWPGKIVLFVIVSLSLWHAAHRMRTALHGLGLRADRAVAIAGYGIAALGTVLSLHYLLAI
ncbi:MAG: fumarate reductase subunit FrdD [Pseudomonadota bacterium]|nr:fumarate reductase subunit FrdD [Pseudomonadota bacterium]